MIYLVALCIAVLVGVAVVLAVRRGRNPKVTTPPDARMRGGGGPGEER